MAATLAPCPSCNRHLYTTAARCPFCGHAAPAEHARRAPPDAPSQLPRRAVMVFAATLGLAAGCASTAGTSDGGDAAPAADAADAADARPDFGGVAPPYGIAPGDF